MDILTQLKSVEEFSTVNHSVIEWLAARVEVCSVPRGRRILSSTDFIHVVLIGRVEAVCLAGCTRKMIVQDIGPSQLIGHIPVLARASHDPLLLVQATSDCELARLKARDFTSLVKLFPEISETVMKNISNSYLMLSKKIEELTVFSAKARLYLFVLRLTEGKKNSDVLAPTHEAIAAHISSHREAVTREMRELERMGLLSYTRGAIRMIDPSGMRDLFRASVGSQLSSFVPDADNNQYEPASNA